METESGVRVGAEFAAFAALAVGVEGEAFGGPAFEEDDADGGNSIRRGCGEGQDMAFGSLISEALASFIQSSKKARGSVASSMVVLGDGLIRASEVSSR